MDIICIECNKIFKYNYQLIKHQNTKIKCIDKISHKLNNNDKNITLTMLNKIKKKKYNLLEKLNKNDSNIVNNTCNYCNIKFSNKGNVTKHINNSCNIRKELSEEINKITNYINDYNQLKKDIIEDYNNTKIINTNSNNTINSNNTTNNTTNNTNNTTNNLIININTFGKEDLSHIKEKDYIKCLEQKYFGLLEFIKLVHLNKKCPQNHNIMHTNRRNNFIRIFKDGSFVSENKEEILSDILNNNMWRLEDKASELEETNKITEKIVEDHNKFKKNYYVNDKNSIKGRLVAVENILMDNKEIINNTQKIIK
jgi:hypothetical protein